MPAYYADSSVLVKRHLAEAGTHWFQALVAPPASTTIITAHISVVEVVSALQRRVRDGLLRPTDALALRTDFLGLCQVEYTLIGCTDAIIDQSWQLLERHPLRAYDAIQLASALAANTALGAAGLDPATFLCSDQRLRQAATAEGLATDDPSQYP